MNQSSRPRFSVVIPTKERDYTLKYTLETCLTQSFDNYEIVVCDNCSTPATREVVESFHSSRISYVRSDIPLAMSDNWELAVSKATGEYVIVVGDDDGLLPDGLSDVDRILRQRNVRLLRWERVDYSWPDILVSEAANGLRIPLFRKAETLRSRSIISRVANQRTRFDMLPMIYNSAVHSTLLDELRSKMGRVFAARAPDIFSGFSLAYLSKSYLSVGRPMSIIGGSAKSNGVATLFIDNRNPIAEDFYNLNSRAGLTTHPTIPSIPAVPAEIGNSFQWAKQLLFPKDKSLYIDRKRLIVNILRNLKPKTRDLELWQQYLDRIRASLADDQKLLSWFEANYANSQPDQNLQSSHRSRKVGFDGATLHLDAGEFGVTDVMGVAELSAKLLGKMDKTPSFSFYGDLPRRFRSAARIMIHG